MPESKTFRYLEFGAADQTFLAPDLNGLIVRAYAWLYKQTGVVDYRTKALLIMEGGIEAAMAGWIVGTKQFNQHYTSWAALPLIHG